MKTLRILTGVHAGAQLRLEAGTSYRVSATHDADICVSDCGDAGAALSVDAHGTVAIIETSTTALGAHDDAANEKTATTTDELHDDAGDDDAQSPPILLPDFVPFKLGEIVICVGDASAKWPADIELLNALFSADRNKSMPQPATSRRRKILAYALCSALILLGSATLMLLLSSGNGEAAQVRDSRALAQKTAAALVSAGLTELQASVRGPVVVVSGMVRTTGDDAIARSVIKRLAKRRGLIEQHYDVAATIVQDIEEGPGMRGAHVDYLGKGVFKVTGTVDDLARARDALTRLGPSFDGNVRRIDNLLTQSADAGPPTPYSEIISNGNVKFLQSPDGTKHLFAGK